MRYILGKFSLNVSPGGINCLRKIIGWSPVEPRWSSTEREKCKAFDSKFVSGLAAPCVTHVIFDMDGTLLNTEDINYQAHWDYLYRVFKINLTYEVYGSMMGMLATDEARVAIQEFNLPISPEVFLHGVWQGLRTTLETAQLMPGAEDLVRHLKGNCVPIAIASSTHVDQFKLKTKYHTSFFENFCPIVMEGVGYKIPRGKPNPDIFQLTARLFPNPPQCYHNCLVVEDSPNGIIAAHAAGMYSLMVPSPYLPTHFIDLVRPSMVLTSLEMFRPEFFGLPQR